MASSRLSTRCCLDKAVTPLTDAEIVAFARTIQPVTTATLDGQRAAQRAAW